jgi:8-oxo-dGTP pyrophosphatase MutT (NUDIX family)
VSDEPLRCVGALILDDDGRIFIQRRASQRRLFPSCWDIVGGHVEPGESVDEALHREVFEETGWQISCILGAAGEVAYRGDDGLDRVEHDFLVRVDGDLGRPTLESGKHTEWRWISEADLDLNEHRAPGDLLTCRIVAAGFAAARALGLAPS